MTATRKDTGSWIGNAESIKRMIAMRKAGMSYRKIAEAEMCSASTVHEALVGRSYADARDERAREVARRARELWAAS